MHDSGTPAEGKPVLHFFCFLLDNVQWCNKDNVSLSVIQEKGSSDLAVRRLSFCRHTRIIHIIQPHCTRSMTSKRKNWHDRLIVKRKSNDNDLSLFFKDSKGHYPYIMPFHAMHYHMSRNVGSGKEKTKYHAYASAKCRMYNIRQEQTRRRKDGCAKRDTYCNSGFCQSNTRASR